MDLADEGQWRSPRRRSRTRANIYAERVKSGPRPATLVDLLEDTARASWMSKGACLDAPNPDAWFPAPGAHDAVTREAVKVCQGCPVRKRCLQYAVEHPDPLHGIWGGRTEQYRRAARRERRLTA